MPTNTRTALLDATLAALESTTLSQLSLEDVAAGAGVSRQTLYRHFGNRGGLIEAVVVREEERLLAELTDAVRGRADARDAIAAAVMRLLGWTRDHALLNRLLAEDPHTLVPLLTTGAGPVLAVAQAAIEDIVADRLPAADTAFVAEVLTRLMISFAVNPSARDPQQTATMIADLIINGVAPPAVGPAGH